MLQLECRVKPPNVEAVEARCNREDSGRTHDWIFLELGRLHARWLQLQLVQVSGTPLSTPTLGFHFRDSEARVQRHNSEHTT
jgi:hypothetical protein